MLNDTDIAGCMGLLFPTHLAGNSTIDPDTQIQPASIDLRLGTSFWRFKMGMPDERRVLDPKQGAAEYMVEQTIGVEDYYDLKPGGEHFCLATTMEYIRMPNDLVARVDGRSSLGRLGLRVHSTAGFVDPGFNGCITLEMDVVSRYPVRLRPGMRICQLSFERLESPAERPYGHPSRHSKYQGQTSTTPSRVDEDK